MSSQHDLQSGVDDASPLEFLAELRRSGRLTITAEDEAIIAAVTSGGEWSDELDAMSGSDASVNP